MYLSSVSPSSPLGHVNTHTHTASPWQQHHSCPVTDTGYPSLILSLSHTHTKRYLSPVQATRASHWVSSRTGVGSLQRTHLSLSPSPISFFPLQGPLFSASITLSLPLFFGHMLWYGAMTAFVFSAEEALLQKPIVLASDWTQMLCVNEQVNNSTTWHLYEMEC